jgi:diguanylate cyclase (GGDEF)-like protein
MREMQQQQRNARVLVIDDQAVIHEDFRQIIGKRDPGNSPHMPLGGLGAGDLLSEAAQAAGDVALRFDLDSAYQGEEGCGMVERAVDEGRPYAMAIVDVHMPPGWDGITTVQRIWEIDPQVLIVLCSGRVERSWEQVVEKLGHSDRFLILKKPFDSVEVRQIAMALNERWNLARTDNLTGAMNRRAMGEQLEREWARSVRHEMPLSCVMLDLDFFKKINDIEGHQAGDAVLKHAVQVLQARCRGSDYLFRYGGEEFCVLLPHTTEEQAAAWAGRAREALAAMQLAWGERTLSVTASFGVAERLEDTGTAEALVDRADQMLRAAKQAGRNRVVRYTAMNPTLGDGYALVQNRTELFEGVTVSRVMSEQVAVLRRDVAVGEAARFFLDCRLNSAPVVDEEGKLVGIVSERDVLGVILCPEARTWAVERIMQPDVVSYDADTPILKVFEFLSRVTMRRVIIVRQGRPVGIVTQSSLLRWFSSWSDQLNGPLAPRDDLAPGYTVTQLVEAAQSLARRAAQLSAELSSADGPIGLDEVVHGSLIGSVSAMQELLADLLAFSRADRHGEHAASAVGLVEGLAAPELTFGASR